MPTVTLRYSGVRTIQIADAHRHQHVIFASWPVLRLRVWNDYRSRDAIEYDSAFLHESHRDIAWFCGPQDIRPRYGRKQPADRRERRLIRVLRVPNNHLAILQPDVLGI